MNYLTGTIGENRVLTFGSAAVYRGEQNGTALKIDISDWQEALAGFYTLTFEVSSYERFTTARITSSSTGQGYISGNYLYYILSETLTSTSYLKVQISAHWMSGETETIEKSSVATIKIGQSIKSELLFQDEKATLLGQIDVLESRIEAVENSTVDFDYGLVYGVGKLLYKSESLTPLKEATDTDDGADKIEEMVEDFDTSTMEYAMVIIPKSGTNPAKLAIIRNTATGITTSVYSGNALLTLLQS